MLNKLCLRTKRGIGLLELLLAFTIIVVLLTMVLRYYSVTRTQSMASAAAQQYGFLATGLSNFAKDQSNEAMSTIDFTNDQANLAKYLPDNGLIKISTNYFLDTGIGGIVLQKDSSSTGENLVVSATTNGTDSNIDEKSCRALGKAYTGKEILSGTPAAKDNGCHVPSTGTNYQFFFTFTKQ